MSKQILILMTAAALAAAIERALTDQGMRRCVAALDTQIRAEKGVQCASEGRNALLLLSPGGTIHEPLIPDLLL